MSPGETLKLFATRKRCPLLRNLCKRPIKVVITKQDDGN